MKKITIKVFNCTECKHCSPVCVGGCLCEKTGEISMIDFSHTEHYCNGKDYEYEQR